MHGDAGGCFVIWMITQEPPFVMTLTGSQKTSVLVIETGTFHRNVIRKNLDQLVTGLCQITCVFKILGLKTKVKAG